MNRKCFLYSILAVAVVFMLSSCGSGSIDGIWVADDSVNNTTLVIDGNVGYVIDYMDNTNQVAMWSKCTIDSSERTISIYDTRAYATNPVYQKKYKLTGDKLVLETANDTPYMDGYYSNRLPEEELRDSSEIPLNGEWVNEYGTLVIDGDSGYMDYFDYNDYYSGSCKVDETNRTITMPSAALGKSDLDYEYYIINGKLLLFSDSEKQTSIEKTILMDSGSEYDASGKERPNPEEKSKEWEEEKKTMEEATKQANNNTKKEKKEETNIQKEAEEFVKDKLVTDTGSKQIWEIQVKDGKFRMVADYSGRGNFIVKISDGNQNLEEVLCNEIGDYHLDKTVYVQKGFHYLEIEATDGTWEGQWYGTYRY